MKKMFHTISIFMFIVVGIPLMGQESFFEICKTGSPDAVKKALKAGATITANEYGITPLMWAAQYNPNPEVINVFIKNGANVNETDPTGTTPLMYAASNTTNPEVIIVLIKAGADIKMKDNNAKTAYALAEWNDNINKTPAYDALKIE